jgi:hypothetical protein
MSEAAEIQGELRAIGIVFLLVMIVIFLIGLFAAIKENRILLFIVTLPYF